MQMASTGFGAVIIPSLMGVLALRLSLEVIPLVLVVVYAALFGVYVLEIRLRQRKAATVPGTIT